MSYTNKTQPTNIEPKKYLNDTFPDDENIQAEAITLIDIFTKMTGYDCVMWRKMFGFGKYYYKDSNGGEHSYFMTGFSISKSGFTLYNIMGWENYHKEMSDIGKYKLTGNSCMNIKTINDINVKILQDIVQKSILDIKKNLKS